MLVKSRIPEYIGTYRLEPEEYCYHVYMPIRCITGNTFSQWYLPKSLYWLKPLLYNITWADLIKYDIAYVTVKHTYTSGYQNRGGWHIDGFGGDDINYIWVSDDPTEVCVQDFELSEDHVSSLMEMEALATEGNIVKLEEKTLYRLDTSVVHRCPFIESSKLRTFVKISMSNEIYNLKGNTSNPMIPTKVFDNKQERVLGRNHPVSN